MSNGDNLNLTLNDSGLTTVKRCNLKPTPLSTSAVRSSRRADRTSQNGGSGKSEEAKIIGNGAKLEEIIACLDNSICG